MMKLMRTVLTGMLAGLVLCSMGWALLEGLKREADRNEAVREYNCKHYGAAVNKHYGQKLCP